MEKCIGCELCAGGLPGRLHLRARRRQPADAPGLAGRALRVRLRDQLPALHPLRPVRRGLPDRGDHRVEAVRVLLHQPGRRDLHQGRAARRRRRPARSSSRGRTGARATTAHLGWMRATSPSGSAAYEGEVQWSGELGYGVRPPEGGQSDQRDDAATGNIVDPRGSRTRPRSRGIGVGGSGRGDGRARLLLGCPRRVPDATHLRASAGGRSPSSAPSASCSRATRSTPRYARHDALRGRRALRRGGRRVPGRGAGHRLRRGHRRPVPVRDHAARRRPPGVDRAPTRSAASGPSPFCSASCVLVEVILLARGATGRRARTRSRAAARGRGATSRKSRAVDLHDATSCRSR